MLKTRKDSKMGKILAKQPVWLETVVRKMEHGRILGYIVKGMWVRLRT